MDGSTPITTGSVLAGLEEFAWSDDESRSFEVALDGISMLVGEYTALIAAEGRKDKPDQQALAAWRAERQQWLARQRSLRRGDYAATVEANQECAAALRRLTGRDR